MQIKRGTRRTEMNDYLVMYAEKKKVDKLKGHLGLSTICETVIIAVAHVIFKLIFKLI